MTRDAALEDRARAAERFAMMFRTAYPDPKNGVAVEVAAILLGLLAADESFPDVQEGMGARMARLVTYGAVRRFAARTREEQQSCEGSA